MSMIKLAKQLAALSADEYKLTLTVARELQGATTPVKAKRKAKAKGKSKLSTSARSEAMKAAWAKRKAAKAATASAA